MYGYFLLWDEELTNLRHGRKYGTKYGIFNSPYYTPDDLVFWFHFYLLFYDALYVPVNFPTDLKCMPEVLKKLRIDEANSTLKSDLQPLRFTWDVSRWKDRVDNLDLEELGRSMLDEVDVSLRVPEKTQCAMKQLKRTLSHECIVPYEPPKCEDDSYRVESIKHLKSNIFKPDALVYSDDSTKDRIERCRKCLLAIEKLGKDKNYGYGRNFYYTIWGYAKKDGPDSKLMKQYDDIRREYENIKHEFLCGVDYVSHSLKAKFANASDQLTQAGIDLELLMPWDFTEIIKPVAKKNVFCANHDMPINMKERDMCIIDKDKILNLKKKQLETLHDSDEYKEFKVCMQRRKTASQAELTESQRRNERGKLQEAFDVYIQRIRRELNPKQHYTDKCLTIMRNHSDVLGEGLLLLAYIHFLPLAGVNGAKWLMNKKKSAISRAIEMLPGKIVEATDSIMLPKKSFPVAIAPLAKDVPLYFKPESR